MRLDVGAIARAASHHTRSVRSRSCRVCTCAWMSGLLPRLLAITLDLSDLGLAESGTLAAIGARRRKACPRY